MFLYSATSAEDDDTTALRAQTDQWRPIVGMRDDEAAAAIQRDQIDILIDLTGHTANARLPVFARKPAPVQATYLGYPNTTGLSTIDYRITDAIADPPGLTESIHTERLERLPDAFFCYLTVGGVPDVGPLPAMTRGGVTFAVTTNFAKVRPATMALWAKILHAAPKSRLLIQAKGLEQPATRDRVTQFFADQGIPPDRLDLRGPVKLPVFLRLFSEIDIVLDTFPFNGGTTTCHGLWMGLPIITIAGIAGVSRIGASVLKHIGLSDLVAGSTEQYMENASRLSRDQQRLARLRESLRDRMRASALMGFERHTRELEAAYRNVWIDWCSRG